ncbi:hypothetical protein Hanom_Chr10g00928431 [Helianthus anomalus]
MSILADGVKWWCRSVDEGEVIIEKHRTQTAQQQQPVFSKPLYNIGSKMYNLYCAELL